jgi:hypothetical protein
MKKSTFAMMLAMASVTFLPLAFNAQAQTTPPPNQTTANGTTGVVINQTGPANTLLNGEFGGGAAGSTYTVNDPANANGNAATTGTATGSNTGPVVSSNGTTITANGNSKSAMSTLASGNGAIVDIGTFVNAEQGSWSGTTANPNATTFANASEYTSGGASGTASGSGTVSQNGAGVASGENTAQTINVGDLNVISTFKTTGLSSGVISTTPTDPAATQQATANVSGSLAANGAALAGNPKTGTWSDTYGSGSATYNGTSPNGTIHGAGEVSGQNNAVINMNTPNQASVSGSSVVVSQAQIKK